MISIKALLFTMMTVASTTTAFVPIQKNKMVSSTQRFVSELDKMAQEASGLATKEPKVCIITGSSQGLGQAMAYELAKYGQKIVVNYYPGAQEKAQETVDQIELLGGDGIAVPADCTNPEQIEKMFDAIMDHYGKVDVLINNAGITKDNLVMRMKPEDFQAVINVNLSGDFHVTQAFLKHAVKNGDKGARIVNIASVVGQIGNPGQANYAASKGGVIGFTKSLAVELAEHNIKVNAVCPGFIESPMTAKLTPEQLEASCSAIPLKRLGKAKHVAAMCRFLAIDDGADYITGHCFDVDGGIGIAAA